jgi:hypothetical protein
MRRLDDRPEQRAVGDIAEGLSRDRRRNEADGERLQDVERLLENGNPRQEHVDAQSQKDDQWQEDTRPQPQTELCALVVFLAAFFHGGRVFSSFHRYVSVLPFASIAVRQALPDAYLMWWVRCASIRCF